MFYISAPYIQCGSCYAVNHMACFFAFVKHIEGERINCPGCHNEIGINADVLLVPTKHQLPHNWNDYKNDVVLLLDLSVAIGPK